MFTGLVEATGTVAAKKSAAGGAFFEITCPFDDLALGESVSVSGACLTVARVTAAGFGADVSAETCRCTTLAELGVGAHVNLERALKASDRLGGHIVTGHVDAVSEVRRLLPEGDALQVWFHVPPALRRFVAPKGSVTIDGVSLTVNQVEKDELSVMLIPHTRQQTTLSDLRVGTRVNFEADTVARYVARQLELLTDQSSADLLGTLQRAGFA